MVGMVPGNGHPYSWSAIINGYDRTAMAACPYPGIIRYLGGEPFETVGVPGAQVTHLWTDAPADAGPVARACLIPHVVDRPEEVIGLVDGVFVASGDGFDHVKRARPFVDAGLPVFVDKPLALTVQELRTFMEWKRGGARLLSSSALRYAPELDTVLAELPKLGELRWISSMMGKDWENYAIHALEPVFRLLGPGFVSIRVESQPKLDVAHFIHRGGVQVNLPIVYDGGATSGTLHVTGTAGQTSVRLSGSDHTYYTAFRRQLLAFIDFVRAEGSDPYPFAETLEMMLILIAGLRSRAEGGRRVEMAEIRGTMMFLFIAALSAATGSMLLVDGCCLFAAGLQLQL